MSINLVILRIKRDKEYTPWDPQILRENLQKWGRIRLDSLCQQNCASNIKDINFYSKFPSGL